MQHTSVVPCPLILKMIFFSNYFNTYLAVCIMLHLLNLGIAFEFVNEHNDGL